MIVSSRIFTIACALLCLAALLVLSRVREPGPAPDTLPVANGPTAMSPATAWQGFQVGHDWVEPSPTKTPSAPPSIARSLIGGKRDPNLIAQAAAECRQPGCRTCQWMQLFGGEW